MTIEYVPDEHGYYYVVLHDGVEIGQVSHEMDGWTFWSPVPKVSIRSYQAMPPKPTRSAAVKAAIDAQTT